MFIVEGLSGTVYVDKEALDVMEAIRDYALAAQDGGSARVEPSKVYKDVLRLTAKVIDFTGDTPDTRLHRGVSEFYAFVERHPDRWVDYVSQFGVFLMYDHDVGLLSAVDGGQLNLF